MNSKRPTKATTRRNKEIESHEYNVRMLTKMLTLAYFDSVLFLDYIFLNKENMKESNENIYLCIYNINLNKNKRHLTSVAANSNQ